MLWIFSSIARYSLPAYADGTQAAGVIPFLLSVAAYAAAFADICCCSVEPGEIIEIFRLFGSLCGTVSGQEASAGRLNRTA